MPGIYIHIPFCRKKCSYCDFHFSTNFSSYRSQMIDSLVDELKTRIQEIENPTTLYFGGGTPSLLEFEELSKIFKSISTRFDLSTFKEITLEANPEDISKESVYNWKKLGIDRLSIGIQSFKESDLEWMNRAHSVEQSRNAIKLTKQAGIENISIDLIYGLPELTLEQWENHIDEVLSWNINHISAYCLTVEKGTALNVNIRDGKQQLPLEELIIRQFELLIKKLTQAGFSHYEISNFGRGIYRAIHNSSYWNGDPYIGIGPSAHSFDGKNRRWNVSNNQSYMKRKDWFEAEVLTEKELWNEFILTGLRTCKGLDLDKLFKISPPDKNFHVMKKKFLDSEWIEEKDEHFILTLEGKLRADFIASEFFRV